MSRTLTKWGALIGIVAGSLLLMASSANAQQRLTPEIENAMRADALHSSALEIQNDLARLPEAARLHIQEAEMRPVTDGSAVDCLTLAANLFYLTKRPLDARRTMEQAAERALSLGDVQRAALLFVNAAHAAQLDGMPEEVNRLGTRADMLAASPLLSDEQRTDLLRRVRRTDEKAKTDRARMAQRADSIHAEALTEQVAGRLTNTARLLKEEAKLRGRTDPGAVDNLMFAAHLLFAANRPLEARHALEDAADRALAAGDVERGARAFIEAAFVAEKQGNKDEATRLGHRAEMLSVSPQLTPAQRQEIARRIRRIPIA